MTDILDPTVVLSQSSDASSAPPPKKRGRPPGSKNSTSKTKAVHGGIDPVAQEQLHEMLLMGFGAITLFMAVELRPTQQELDSILLPAERILLRRVGSLEQFNPDVYDGILVLIGVISYGARIVTVSKPLSFGTPRRRQATGNSGRMAQVPTATETPNANGFSEVYTGWGSIDDKLASLYQTVSRTPTGQSEPNNGVGG